MDNNNIIVINSIDFWQKHREQTQLVLREEIEKLSPKNQPEEILVIEDVCKILRKSKQTIYNYMDTSRITGYYLKGGNLEEANPEDRKRESLFFKRSEIMASLEKRK